MAMMRVNSFGKKYYECESPEEFQEAISNYDIKACDKIIRGVNPDTYYPFVGLVFGRERGSHPVYNDSIYVSLEHLTEAGYAIESTKDFPAEPWQWLVKTDE
jgi:hypothetical protein